MSSRKSSGTIIVSRDAPDIEAEDEEYEDGDARTMSPRRTSEEVDKLEHSARQALIQYVGELSTEISESLADSSLDKQNLFKRVFFK